ncbi:hypothetical protein TWF679_004051 [Orbilia oligospora]|uniref:Piwi domain-containing protein n=1 Tax=Orbilia oligospora TaxID=2813651 RepID=A0A8H8UQI4_ORBOL|nr:hypothetical protein TWF679_004051 [Orbilia oligospora]
MADSLLSLLFGPDGLSPPEWLRLALAGGSRSRPCCQICGSYGHRRRDCTAVGVIAGVIKSGLRAGESSSGRGGPWRGGRRGGEGGGGRGGPWRGGGLWRGGRGGGGEGSSRGGGHKGGRGGFSPTTTQFQGDAVLVTEMDKMTISGDNDNETIALSKRVLAFRDKQWVFPIRKEYNTTSGQPTYVIANYYELKTSTKTKIVRYVFEMTGPNRSKEMVDSFIQREFPAVVEYLCPDYGGYLYAPEEWTPGKQHFTYPAGDEFEGQTFTLKSRLVLNVDGYRDYLTASDVPTSSILPLAHEETENCVIPVAFYAVSMALNAIIIRNPRIKNTYLIHEKGNTMYDSRKGKVLSQDPCSISGLDTGHSAQIIVGLHASVRPGSQRCLVNASKVTNLYYRTLPMEDIVNLREGTYGQGVNLENRLLDKTEEKGVNQCWTGVLIRVDLPDGTSQHRVLKRVHTGNAQQVIWETREGVQVTVEMYSIRMGRPLRFPKVQLLSFKPQRGSIGRCEFPIEWCRAAEGQKFKVRLAASGSRDMIYHSASAPFEYLATLKDEFSNMFHRAQDNLTLSRFGLDFGRELLKIQARTLAMPRVMMGRNSTADIDSDNGSWRPRGKSFHSPAALLPYILLEIRTGARAVRVDPGVGKPFKGLIIALLGKCRGYGMARTEVAASGEFTLWLTSSRDDPRVDIENLFKGRIEGFKGGAAGVQVPLIFCLLPGSDSRYYNAIKRAGDVLSGVLTICMDGNKTSNQRIARDPGSYCETLALKVNLKCGGINHSTQSDRVLQRIFPELENNTVMLLGADVSHSGRRDLPSISAIVGSYEPSHSRLYSEVAYQKNQEMIENMAEGVRSHLDRFHDKHKTLPRFIVMFRDGVSESQYRQVLDREVVAIDAAVDRAFLQSGIQRNPERPKLVVLVVGKRHHTRFFPPGATDKRHKTLPGLVVDRAITAIYEKDFFLQAHAAIQGTPRPAHYFVIRDDMDLSDTQIQELVFTWSFSFGRSFRSVSYAPPAYCADLACGRARAWIQHKVDDIRGGENLYPASASGSNSSSDITAVAQANLHGIAGDCGRLHEDLKETMWYI